MKEYNCTENCTRVEGLLTPGYEIVINCEQLLQEDGDMGQASGIVAGDYHCFE